MDIAEMIILKAQQLELDEKTKDYIECQMIFHIHREQGCIDAIQNFKIFKDLKTQNVIVDYNNVKWKKQKKSKEFKNLIAIIIRQILKNILNKYGSDYEFSDEIIRVNVLNKCEILFTDEYYVMDSIDSTHLSNDYLECCDDNTDLKNIQDMILVYLNLCNDIVN
jgi:hypothetical protein